MREQIYISIISWLLFPLLKILIVLIYIVSHV